MRRNGFKLKEGRFRLDVRKNFFFSSEDGEALAQAVQRNCGCPISRGIQGQVGWHPGQLDLVGGNPVYIRGLGLDDL